MIHNVILGAIVVGCVLLGWFLYKKVNTPFSITVSDDIAMSALNKDTKKTNRVKSLDPSSLLLQGSGGGLSVVKGKSKFVYLDASIKNPQGNVVGFNVMVSSSGKTTILRVPTKVAVYEFKLKRQVISKELALGNDVNHFNSTGTGENDGSEEEWTNEAGYALTFKEGDVLIQFEKTNANPSLTAVLSAKRLSDLI